MSLTCPGCRLGGGMLIWLPWVCNATAFACHVVLSCLGVFPKLPNPLNKDVTAFDRCRWNKIGVIWNGSNNVSLHGTACMFRFARSIKFWRLSYLCWLISKIAVFSAGSADGHAHCWWLKICLPVYWVFHHDGALLYAPASPNWIPQFSSRRRKGILHLVFSRRNEYLHIHHLPRIMVEDQFKYYGIGINWHVAFVHCHGWHLVGWDI